MPYNPDIHHRRSFRLRDYDYSGGGAYFVTICTRERECLFGEITSETVQLTEAGLVVVDNWQTIPHHFPHATLDRFVVMPNHVHGILTIDDSAGAQFTEMNQGAMNRAPTLGGIVRAFKARCTHAINQMRDNPGVPVWQRNYYERVIRDEKELTAIRPNGPRTKTTRRGCDFPVGAQFIAPRWSDRTYSGTSKTGRDESRPYIGGYRAGV